MCDFRSSHFEEAATNFTLSKRRKKSTSSSFSESQSNTTRYIEYNSREISCELFSNADALCFQLRLNSLGDLHRLLSAQFIDNGNNLLHNLYQTDTLALDNDFFSSRPLPLFVNKFTFPLPINQNDLKWPAKPTGIGRKLAEHLFYVYLNDCCSLIMHPNRAAFLESYYRGELEPAMIHTAIAYSALHLMLAHPQMPLVRHLHHFVGGLLEKARQSLEDIFDIPSLQSVLAFLNMEGCMVWLARFDDAYRFYSQAVLMAFSLQMDKHVPHVQDPEQLEFQRRIWALICKNELRYSFELGKPALISFEVIKNSPKPTPNSSDSVRYKIFLLYVMTHISITSKLLEIKEVDWSLPDITIAHQLINAAASLQKGHSELKEFSNTHDLQRYCIFDPDFNFWVCWCLLWRRFIKSDAPDGRLETDLMQQLRIHALNEYVNGLSHHIASLRNAIRAKNWCKNFPFLYVQVICENCKFITSAHPNIALRRWIFRELVVILSLLSSIKNKGVIEHWLIQRITETLEEMKTRVSSKEELEMMNLSKFMPIAIKSTKR
ncbi:uncharacterized protein VTP21DRAFT_4298 [Calcarisporiella thermophila]|uniref:uncharacterized protein n=1 Tax=Calcarisporiella thermophila TaxID=911321 RepID=UPI0037439F50